MEYREVLYEKRGQVAWIYLNRPEDMNSITVTLCGEMEQCLGRAEQDGEVRVLVLSGKGKAFCAGADLKALLTGMGVNGAPGPDFLDRATSMFHRLRSHPRPVIAALNGLTLAGGLELAMACDLVIAAKSAKIGDAHSNFGVFPGAGGATVLPRKIGLNRAKYMLFTGDFVSAEEMMAFGLVNQVVPGEQLEEEVQKLAARLAEKSPLVLRRMKEVANASLDQSEEAALRHELLHLRNHMRSFDFMEGLKAFSEKRKPEFKGE